MSTAVEDSYVGVRFDEETNLTLCRSGGAIFAKGEAVIVELDDGPSYGRVEQSPMPVFKPCQKSSARSIARRASDDDTRSYDRKRSNESAAKLYLRERARHLELDMKISKVAFSLNSKRARVFFTADERIDFRQLVRDTAQRFAAKIKMVHLGSRDEAKLLGGVGVCGQTLCCSTWMTDFRPISIQMAKRQSLSLNPSKISGQCGRLLCCLAYEDDQYPPLRKKRKKPENRPHV